MQQIMLTMGYFTIVDDEDYEKLRWFNWAVHRHEYKDGWVCYASKRDESSNRSTELMHRIIMDCPKEMVVDHISGNGLDNRRCNLRICTQQQNMWNKKLYRRARSDYHGVRRCRGKWLASIRLDGTIRRIGWFEDPISAAKAYDTSAIEHFGEYARLNFPENNNNVSR